MIISPLFKYADIGLSFYKASLEEKNMEKIVKLTEEKVMQEHICCAIADKKCLEGYEMKRQWLCGEMAKGYSFYRIDARAKVFVEFGLAEECWMPISAPNHLVLGCFWVSGQYKGRGYGKELLKRVVDDAVKQGKDGIVAVVGAQKRPFMSDSKWLLKQGFEVCDTANPDFNMLVLRLNRKSALPQFVDCARIGAADGAVGLTAYYSNRCPFTEYYVRHVLVETATKRSIPLRIVKIETKEQGQSAPTPATIFSLYHNGRFVTTDLSICLDSKFDKLLAK
jgi:L-amino acid N-acyltransferase YncA